MSVQATGSPQQTTETVATFWAHYDDDLVFANPTLMYAIESGHRARSFFFTASDAGTGMSEYTAGRERGIRAAYDTMRGATGKWSDRVLTLRNGVTVTVTRPDDDDRVALTFLRLPDGGLTGRGWFATGHRTLSKLLAGELSSIRTLGTDQDLTLPLLRSTVVEMLDAFGATTVITHDPGFTDPDGADHPDHQSVGRLMVEVVDEGLVDPAAVHYAIGYPSPERPANLGGDILARKLEVFAAYGEHDPVVAREEAQEYLHVRGFGEWLQRQYLEPHAELARPEAPRATTPVDEAPQPTGTSLA